MRTRIAPSRLCTSPIGMRNLLGLMRIPGYFTPVLFWAALTGSSLAQSPAALGQLLAHHSEEDVEQMRQQAHFRYVGEWLFYAASFLVEEDGVERAGTEAEIATIDLHAYDGIRMEAQRTGAHDPLIDKHIILLGRSEFERLVLRELDVADRAAFLAYKSAMLEQPASKTR